MPDIAAGKCAVSRARPVARRLLYGRRMSWPRPLLAPVRAAEPPVVAADHGPDPAGLAALPPLGRARTRERLVEEGCDRLTDLELIAIVLGTGVRGRSAIEVAEALLSWTG